MQPIRHPTVAGRFYSADPGQLRTEVESFLVPGEKAPAIGCVVPHAGYMYSGHVAGAVFSRLAIPPSVLLLCPNHTGRGQALAINSAGAWQTPLGEIPIDSDLAVLLKAQFPLLAEDAEAHRHEHSGEVELPFLQVLRPGLQFVPVAVGTGNLEVLEDLGRAIAQVLAIRGNVLMVASSDMNHYEDDAITRIKDRKAIDQILALNPAGLHHVVRKENISMCGFAPAVVMLTAARELAAKSAALVKYATSGDILGERDRVVGYAGIIVT